MIWKVYPRGTGVGEKGDREVGLLQSRIEVNNYYGYDLAQSVIAIYIPDYDITKEEEKAKHKEEKQK